MKYIIKSFFVILLFVATTSCTQKEDNFDNNINPNSGWIQFPEANSIEVLSTDDTVMIPIDLHAATNLYGIDVSYTTEFLLGTSTLDFGSKSTIKAGTDVAYIKFSPLEIESTYIVKFTLVNSSDSNFSIGLSDNSKPIEFIVKVCSVNLNTTYTGISTAFGADFTPFSAVLSSTANQNEYSLDTAWGDNFVAEATGNPAYMGLFVYPATVIVNPSDNTIQIVGDDFYTTGGTGVIDPCEGTISYTLTQGLFTNPFTVDVVLTAQ